MAKLRQLTAGTELELRSTHLVGRGPNSDLELSHGYVSLQHACLRWTARGWEVKDLGSANGTFVNGVRVESSRLAQGDRISFGREELGWELSDATPPRVMAVPRDGGPPLLVDEGILAIPASDDPRASIYRNANGVWVLEHAEDLIPLANQQTFAVDGQQWVFHSPEAVLATATLDEQAPPSVLDTALHFKVSADEEHVELSVQCAGRCIDLGSRAHHYVLLTLARHKLEDITRRLPLPVCGWVYQDDLTKGLKISPAQLNVDIFRIRRQFGGIGIADAGNIVQRRPRTKQLRIGTRNITETLA